MSNATELHLHSLFMVCSGLDREMKTLLDTMTEIRQRWVQQYGDSKIPGSDDDSDFEERDEEDAFKPYHD